MSAVLGAIEIAAALEKSAALAGGRTYETGVAIAKSSIRMARVAEQRAAWSMDELEILPKWARLANQNDFTAKMSGESMEHWRTRVFQPDLTPSSKYEVKVPHFYKHPWGIEVESHHVSDMPARVYESTKNSVLRIDGLDLFGEGSGAIVDMGREKVLATALHVLEEQGNLKNNIVNFADGTFARVKDYRVGSYPSNDVAMLFVDKDLSRYPALKLGESKSLLPRERLYVLGHPSGSKTTTISAGNLETLDYETMIHRGDFKIGMQEGTARYSIRSVGGQSGGPVVRWNQAISQPEMIGIHSTANNVGSNAVTAEDFLKFVERWRPEAIASQHGSKEYVGEGLTRVIEV